MLALGFTLDRHENQGQVSNRLCRDQRPLPQQLLLSRITGQMLG